MYALIKNNEFVKWIDLQEDYPNTCFPSPITAQDLPSDVVIVQKLNAPLLSSVFQVSEKQETPTYDNGEWKLGYAIREMTENEKLLITSRKSEEVRNIRNSLISNSDWTQLPDASVDKAAWAEYRQNLRDVTSQEGFPFDVLWPTSP